MAYHGLDTAVVRDLVARCGSLPAAAAAAKKVPGFGEQLELLGANVAYTANNRLGPVDDALERYWTLVAAALPTRLEELKGEGGAGERRTRRRGPAQLPIGNVEKAETRLKERWKRVPYGGRGSGKWSYEAIAAHSGLNRDRVDQIEDLMRIGWPLRKSHPDFPAKPGYVRLPTPEQAALLRHLR